MFRATLKSLLARKLRLALTAFAVVLGVGFVAGTLIFTDTLNATFDSLFANAYSGTDVVVQSQTAFEAGAGPGSTSASAKPIPSSVLKEVRKVEGVHVAEGEVSGYAQFIDPATGKAIVTGGAPTLGGSWEPATTAFTLREGTAPSGPAQVVVDAGTASKNHLKVGMKVRVITQSGTDTYAIAGIAGFGTADNLGGATLAIFDTATAQKLFGRVGEYDQINVVAADGVSASTLRERIANILPSGFRAVSGTDAAKQNADQIQSALGFLRTALLVFAAVALFVGSFIIFNTFNIIVTQRSRELGLLRALGASRRQILVSVIVEAFITGLIAGIVGVGLGVLLAKGLRAAVEAFGGSLPGTALQLLPRTVAVAIVVGTVITVIASTAPAVRAARVSPIQALREGGTVPGASLRRRLTIGALVLVGGVGALLLGLFGHTGNGAPLVGLGVAVTFVGAAMLSPFAVRPLAGAIGWPLSRRGVSGRLGRENARRNPRRTASTAAAVMIGLGLVSFVAIFAASLKASATKALDSTLRADFILTANQFQPFSPQLAKDLAKEPSIAAVSPTRLTQIKAAAGQPFLYGVDPKTIGQVAQIDLSSGSLGSLNRTNVILIYRRVAEDLHLSVGDTIPITFLETGKTQLTVGGVYTDDRLLNDFIASLKTYDANVSQPLDQAVYVKAVAGQAAAASKAIDGTLRNYPNVQSQDQAQFRESQVKQVNSFLALVLVLLILAVVIAFFGIVNTLGLSIYERIRELGLVRAIGLSRWKVGWMVLVEAVIVAVLGAVLGLVIGVGFGVAMQKALEPNGITELAFPIGQLVSALVLAALAGVLASIWPGWRASRIDVLQAIAYE